MSLLSEQRRIVITGPFGSGKSVLMLSLLHHLSAFDARHFRLGDKRLKRPVEVKSISSTGVSNSSESLPYKEHLKRLLRPGGGEWPRKTQAILRFKGNLRRSDRFRATRFSLMSFPLERLVDLGLARAPRYDDWCERTLQQISEDAKGAREIRRYLHALDAPQLVPTRLLNSYKHSLAQFIFHYKPFVSPSTFMIGLDGDRIMGGSAEAVIQGRYLGLPPLNHEAPREFLPLSGIARLREPEFCEQMAANYEAYRQEVSLPLFRELNQADTLVILLDIPSLLSAGRPAYEEISLLLKRLNMLLRRQDGQGEVLGRSKIRRLALVANKADLIRIFDRDARIPNLLRELCHPLIDQLDPRIEVGRFICSPCMSTRPGNTPEKLIGRVVHSGMNPQRLEKPFPV
ncbi:MAG: YcjX family protein, partial [Myxococcota bacterium]|nr:YcjX family protein [Myxococcota bacterium]